MKRMTRIVRTAVVVAVMTIALPAAAQTCLEMEGKWPYGPASAIEMSGTTAYVAMGSALKIFDLIDPAAPVELGEISVPGPIANLTVDGSHVYLAAERAGLRIIDVSTPAAPVEVGFDAIGGSTKDVAVSGGYAYVADNRSLWVFDVTMPAQPAVAAYSLYLSGVVNAIAVSGSHAFLTLDESGTDPDLIVIDISDPTTPTQVGSLVTAAYWSPDIDVNGTHAYLVDNTGLRVLDISSPTAPVEVGSYDPIASARSVALDGSYAHLGVGSPAYGRIDVIDITTPTAPSRVAQILIPAVAIGIAASGHQATVVAGRAGLRVIDWWLGTELSFVDAPGEAIQVEVRGTVAFVADRKGLRIFDVSTPLPAEIGFYPSEDISVLDVVGDYAYLAGYNQFRIVDVTDPANPTEAGLLSFVLSPAGLSVSGGYAYVPEGNSGVRVIDVSTPSAPLALGVFDTPGFAWGIEVSADVAYVADGNAGGLRLFDVTSPAAPVELGSIDTPGSCSHVAVSAGYAYVADRGSGLRVIDVSDPGNPREIGALDSTSGFYGSAYVVSASGSMVYFTDWFSTLYSVEISDPSVPVLAEFAKTPGRPYGLAVEGDRVFTADFDAGMSVSSQCTAQGRIFANGFENGNTLLWSAASP